MESKKIVKMCSTRKATKETRTEFIDLNKIVEISVDANPMEGRKVVAELFIVKIGNVLSSIHIIDTQKTTRTEEGYKMGVELAEAMMYADLERTKSIIAELETNLFVFRLC